MATQPQRTAAKLIARIEASRAAMGSHHDLIRRRWDLPARIKDSILSKPLNWLGGSLAAGFLTSMLLKKPRAREEKKRRGLWSLAIGGAFALARPALQSWALAEAKKRFVIPGNDTVRHS